MQTMVSGQQPHKLTPKEQAFVEVLRQIYEGQITDQQVIEQRVPNYLDWRDIAEELLSASVRYGEEMYWTCYDTMAKLYMPLVAWRPLITAPRHQEGTIPQTPRSAAILLSEVQEREIGWLWEQRLALGKLTMLDGDPGQGKSMLTLDLAARVSRGLTMPDHTRGLGEPAGVILITPEDDLADTVKPRLRRAGADANRVSSLSTIKVEDPTSGLIYERSFSLSQDLPELERAIDESQVRLVIIDPIMAVVGDRDVYHDNKTRTLLAPLVALLEKKQVAGIAVRHLTKGGSGGNLLHRGGGSVAFTGVARTTMIVLKDPYDEHRSVLAQTKSNIGRMAEPLSFSVETDEPPNDRHPHVRWHGPCPYTLDELQASSVPTTPRMGASKPNTARDEILRVLQEHAPNPLSLQDIVDKLPDLTFSTIRVTLSRLAKESAVEMSGRGMYFM